MTAQSPPLEFLEKDCSHISETITQQGNHLNEPYHLIGNGRAGFAIGTKREQKGLHGLRE